MPDTVTPSAEPDPGDILATLERCLDAIDSLGLGVVAAQLSLVVETLRTELGAGSDSVAANVARP